jgi:energy-coupling factor transporter ATP-binding protein EcfA2
MKKLSKMLLIHWHNYEKEVISFDMINFLTGKTAAGKSTIIDALQLVLLGDTTGTFFNKAANQKSTRTLKSYLFGELGDDGDTGFRYMRNERFTSYVALEFEDTERNNKFTTGIICDCYRDQNFDYKWFMLHKHGFPDGLFVNEETKVPYDISGLRSFLSVWLGKKSNLYDFYDTNKRYQEVTLAKFGQIKNKYRMLLKKAVPFSPIADIEQFITESICDVKNNIQIEQMQSDIRQYKNLEEDARKTEERIGFLREINKVNQDYEKEKEKYNQQHYIVVRAEKEEYLEKERQLKKEISKKEELIRQHQEQMRSLAEENKKIKKELDALEKEYLTSDIVQREKFLRQELDKLNGDIERLQTGIDNAFNQLKHYGQLWVVQLEKLNKAGFRVTEEYGSLAEHMDALVKEQIISFSFERAASQMKQLLQEVNDYKVELKKRYNQLKEDLNNLTITVENLEKGIKPFPYQITALKRLLEKELFDKYKKTVEVSVLADLLEIRNPEWRNAIEGYLDKQKFYLLVPENYYMDALRIYNQEKKDKDIYDAGLIDVGKLRKTFRKMPIAGSLAEEIETEHVDARLYADYLLGGVMKCTHVSELNRYKVAITASGMLYKGYVSRKINPMRYANPFIGRHSMELLLEQNRIELERLGVLYENIAETHRLVFKASETSVLGEYEAQQHQKAVAESEYLEKLRNSWVQVREEYDMLDFQYLDRMKKKIDGMQEAYTTKDNIWHDLDKKNAKLDTELENIRREKLPETVDQIIQVQIRLDREFDSVWLSEVGEPRFLEVQAVGNYEVSLKTRFYSAMKQTESKRDGYRSTRTEKRAKYNADYKMPYDIELESNQYFDKELNELEQIRLPEYIDKIVDSKEKAYNQFRDDFIAKIKSNIDSVSQQIDELNASLKQSVFGTDRYRFVKKTRPEYQNYYDMIMDPLLMDTGGWNIASQSFNEKYQKEIDELFQLLIYNETNVTAERRAEYEKSIRKFTDYKTYLVFDLIVTDEQGEEQRLSKTLLKKSGGETQIPFYIALLASFSQVCRLRNKNQNNTIRVIILDEAFSKMDGERIRESIMLLRRFGLQSIFSAPPDKIPDIAPLVDRNIAVYKDNRHSFTRSFDPKEIEELIEA